MTELVPEEAVQPDFFEPPSRVTKRAKEIDRVVDELNRKLGRNAVRYGAMGLQSAWAMRQENRSGCFTTRWDEIPTAKA